MTTQVERLISILATAVQPLPDLPVSEWADTYRMLPPESAEPGKWRTARAPYLRDPMDRMGAWSTAHTIILLFASQLGKSEAINNLIGYCMHQAPCGVIMSQPTVETAEVYAKMRIRPMVRSTPELAALLPLGRRVEAGEEEPTLRFLSYRGGYLRMIGSNSPAEAASLPAKIAIIDEADRTPASVGGADGEGSLVELLRQRTVTFGARAKMIVTSTPTNQGESLIQALYEQSDQSLYHVPCPHCGEMQALEWEALRWTAADGSDAAVVCSGCGTLITHGHKSAMLANGEWRATYPERTELRPGYFLSALYSPWLSWASLVASYLDAGIDPEKLRVFYNVKLARPWDVKLGDRMDANTLLLGRERYPQSGHPVGISILTAGVDVQGDRLEVSVWGWGLGESAWLIDHHVIVGDTSADEPWTQLADYLGREWRRADGKTQRIQSTCVDSGYRTSIVYRWVGLNRHLRLWPIKGRSGPDVMLWSRGKRVRAGVMMHTIGVDAAKMTWRTRLEQVGQPGAMVHFPDAEWCGLPVLEQYTSEAPVTTRGRGRQRTVWVRGDATRNEAWDCAVYAMAALHERYAAGLRLRVEPEVAQPSARVHTETSRSHSETPQTGQAPAAAPEAPRPIQQAAQRKRRPSSFWGM